MPQYIVIQYILQYDATLLRYILFYRKYSAWFRHVRGGLFQTSISTHTASIGHVWNITGKQCMCESGYVLALRWTGNLESKGHSTYHTLAETSWYRFTESFYCSPLSIHTKDKMGARREKSRNERSRWLSSSFAWPFNIR